MVCMHIIGSRIQRSHSWHVLESELEHVPWCMHARQHTCTRTQTSIASAIYGADKHHFSMVTEHGRLVMFRTCWTSRMCTPLLALGKAIEQDTKGCLGSLAFPSPGCLSCLDYTRLSASHSDRVFDSLRVRRTLVTLKKIKRLRIIFTILFVGFQAPSE